MAENGHKLLEIGSKGASEASKLLHLSIGGCTRAGPVALEGIIQLVSDAYHLKRLDRPSKRAEIEAFSARLPFKKPRTLGIFMIFIDFQWFSKFFFFNCC